LKFVAGAKEKASALKSAEAQKIVEDFPAFSL
jgi:hypothetical protein